MNMKFGMSKLPYAEQLQAAAQHYASAPVVAMTDVGALALFEQCLDDIVCRRLRSGELDRAGGDQVRAAYRDFFAAQNAAAFKAFASSAHVANTYSAMTSPGA